MVNILFWRKKNKKILNDGSPNPQQDSDFVPVPKTLAAIREQLKLALQDSSDLIYREILVGNTKALMIHIDGMAGSEEIEKVHNSLLEIPGGKESSIKTVMSSITTANVIKHRNFKAAILDMLKGNILLALDESASVLTAEAKNIPNRAIEEPASEAVIRGPRDGFTEELRINTALIRKRLNTPNLIIQDLSIGEYSRTRVSLAWLHGVADPDIIAELKSRLERIEIDGILESGYIEEFIEDNPRSPFPQLRYTERPDITTAAILEGRVAILTDHTPFALIAPVSFWQFIQANEDYYERPVAGTILRWLRLVSLGFSLLFPAFYVAATTYHQEMIPTQLALGIAGAREGIPFPALLEALLMIGAFEALREAGVRLPKPSGQAISIAGSLIIGLAAVEAGLVSPAMIIVIASTAIASFTIPYFGLSISVRLLRVLMVIAAGAMGLYGVIIVFFALLLHMCSLRSLGLPYMAPVAPLNISDLKDVPVRFPLWGMFSRPWSSGSINRTRLSRGAKPRFPDRKDET